MNYNESEMSIIIATYQKQGIVTRDDYSSIDSRPFARGLESEMQRRGYSEARYTEANTEGFADYSGVLYDSTKYSLSEAKEYLLKYVLSSEG